MALIVDVDSHVYEPPEIWDHYVPAEYRGMARTAFYHEVDGDGDRITILNGAPGPEMGRSRLIRQALWKPGMTPEVIGRLDPDVFVPLTRGAFDPAARLADMDALGVDQAVVFPTLFNEYLPLVVNPDAAAVLARAYNDWVWDFAAAAGGRIQPTAVLPMHSVLLARRELDRVAGKGFRAVVIRPAFYHTALTEDHSPRATAHRAMRAALGTGGGPGANPTSRVFVEDKPFRRLWQHIDELDLVACVHPSLGVAGPDAVSSGGFAERVSARLGVTHTITEPMAYMQDADLFVTAALFHGLLEDLPRLRLAIVHAGTSWVPLALEKSETYLWLTPFGMLESVCLEPEEVWDRHPLIVSFDGWERSVGRMPDVFGSKAAWGSRYPHHDASAPSEALAMLAANRVDQATIDQLMGANAAGLFRLDVPVGV